MDLIRFEIDLTKSITRLEERFTGLVILSLPLAIALLL
uniref:6-phosphofructokinase n=1 Tax=Arundo donax TaxID=35708 RepID=A0A0A9EU18_ARUDO